MLRAEDAQALDNDKREKKKKKKRCQILDIVVTRQTDPEGVELEKKWMLS